MGGLWADYEKSADGGLKAGSPRNQMTNIPGLYALGECDYQYHGANRLGANSLLSCIFSGLVAGPGVQNYINHKSQRPLTCRAVYLNARWLPRIASSRFAQGLGR